MKEAILILSPPHSDRTSQLSLGSEYTKREYLFKKSAVSESELKKTTFVLLSYGQWIDIAKKRLHRKSVFVSKAFFDTFHEAAASILE
jgi:hypothetical protein